MLDTLYTTLFSTNTTELNTVIVTIVGVIWIYCVLWTVRDIYARSDNVGFQFFSIVLVLIGSPVIGLPLYLLIRPISRKDDVMGRQMIMDMESIPCGACYRPNLTGYDHCVFCGGTLKIQCKNCKEMYPHTHQYCYKCGAPNITWKQ